MKWFKHYSNASDSVSLNRLIDDLGLQGYGRYWLLMELLSSEYDGENEEFEIHFRTISAKLQLKFTKSLETFMSKLSDFGLIEWKVDKKVYFLRAPILAELKSRDYKRARSERAETVPKIKNKIKDIDIEKTAALLAGSDGHKKKSRDSNALLQGQVDLVEHLSKINDTMLINLWNSIFGKTHQPFNSFSLGGGSHMKNFMESAGFLPSIENWEELFRLCQESDWLMGKLTDRNCSWFTLTWIIQHDNIVKVKEGKYRNEKGDSGVSKINSQLIFRAVNTNARRISELGPEIPLSDADKDWIAANGGLLQLGQMNEFNLKVMLKI